jgi:hypothetical protein
MESEKRMRMKSAVRYAQIWRFYLIDLFKWMIRLFVRHPDRIRQPSYFDWKPRIQNATSNCKRARVEFGWI